MSDNPIFSYTKRDYERSRKEGLAQIPALSKGNWTDLNATDPGIILLDYVHALVDMVNYYQDHQALEVFLTTAKERVNIFRLAKQKDYRIPSAKGAICNVTFTSDIVYSTVIKIPKHTSISTLSEIKYLTMEDAYLLAGETSVDIPCYQGELKSMTYTGTGISKYSNAVGAEDQSVLIVEPGIDIDSIIVTDSLGKVWSPVDYIVFSTATDKVYQKELCPDNSILIRFGDGERGVIPKATDTFTISYITTLGDQGRVGADALVKVDSELRDSRGNYVEFIISNKTASSGGSYAQSSTEIRELAPGVIKAQGRAVTLEDYEYLARYVDGVKNAKAYDINTSPDTCLYHEVKVLIIPEDLEGSTELLKKNVYNFLSQRIIPPTNLQILTPSVTPIDIEIVVKRVEYSLEGGLEYIIQSTVEDYFARRSSDIGEGFYPTDLATEIRQIPEIRYVVSITPNLPVEIAETSIATLGKLSIVVQ